MLHIQSAGMALMPRMTSVVRFKSFTCLRIIAFLGSPGVQVKSAVDGAGQLARMIENQFD